jgi:hypothetical protein
MAHLANAYRVVFHRAPQHDEPFRWHIRGELVTAFSEDVAIRLARRSLDLDDSWRLRVVEDLGKWNQCKELM